MKNENVDFIKAEDDTKIENFSNRMRYFDMKWVINFSNAQRALQLRYHRINRCVDSTLKKLIHKFTFNFVAQHSSAHSHMSCSHSIAQWPEQFDFENHDQ